MTLAWLALTLAAAPLQAGDWTLSTTEERGTATNGKETLVLWDGKTELKGCADSGFSAKLLSVVGTWVSFEVNVGGDCGGAHPMAWHGFKTIDLAQHGKEVKLDALVKPADVDAAVLADPYVKKLLAAQNKKTIDDLDSCELYLPGVHDAHFAFVEAGKDTVGVRVAPGHGYEVCRGAFVMLGLTLKASPALIEKVKAAAVAKTLFPQLAH